MARGTVGTGAILALDLGSSSVRALVFDRDASRAVLLERQPVQLHLGPDGRAEFDAEEYLGAVATCIDRLHARRALAAVSDVVLACQWHSVVALLGAKPVGPLLTWADTRSSLVALTSPERAALHERTGAWPHSQYWTGKLPWLRDAEPRATSFVGLAELLCRWLLDDASASLSMASGTGLLDWRTGRWDVEALEVAGVTASALPQLQPPGWTGRLNAQWRRRWPPLASAVWHPAVGDGAAANIGTGCVQAPLVNVTIGTSAAVRVVQPRSSASAVSPALWRYLVDADRVVSGVAFSAGGGLLDRRRSLLGLPLPSSGDDPGLELIPAGSEGVTALPFDFGARAPRDVVPGTDVVAGLGPTTSSQHVLSAVMEAVCFELAEAVEVIEIAMSRRAEVVASGGALEASALWRSRLAAALGRTIRMASEPEASARGAAIVHPGDRNGLQSSTYEVIPVAADIEQLIVAKHRFDRLRAQHGVPALNEWASPSGRADRGQKNSS